MSVWARTTDWIYRENRAPTHPRNVPAWQAPGIPRMPLRQSAALRTAPACYVSPDAVWRCERSFNIKQALVIPLHRTSRAVVITTRLLLDTTEFDQPGEARASRRAIRSLPHLRVHQREAQRHGTRIALERLRLTRRLRDHRTDAIVALHGRFG